jgi:hypothetical protein
MLVIEYKWEKKVVFLVKKEKRKKPQLEIPIKTQIKSEEKRKR